MNKVNQKKTLALKYASSLFNYVLKQDQKSIFDPSLSLTFENLYEKNLFQVKESKDKIKLEKITDEIRFLNFFLTESDNFFNILKDPIYSSSKKIDLIYSALPGLHPLLKAFIKVLGEKNHLTLIPDIVEEYNKSLHNFLGIKYLTLVFGAIPSENQLIEIKKNLFTLFQMNEVVLQLVFDSSLLGGFIIYENSRKFDFSLKGKLQKIIQSI